MRTPTPLYVGTNGIVAALDAQTGEELWRSRLPRCGGGGAPVAMVIRGTMLYAGANGRVWCLDKRTGALLWQNGLPKMGYHAVLLAMEGAQADSGPDPGVIEARRQHQRQAAIAAGGATT